MAHQAAGIVLREFGDVGAGVAELRRALRLARRTGRVEREADVLASLAVALVYAGRTTAGLATFDQALRLSRGLLAGQVLHRRSLALLALGRHAAALEDAPPPGAPPPRPHPKNRGAPAGETPPGGPPPKGVPP
ncbi:MAG: hypothetical protein ACHP9Z_15995, partial [Streptosporangiales bacterium]